LGLEQQPLLFCETDLFMVLNLPRVLGRLQVQCNVRVRAKSVDPVIGIAQSRA